MEDREDKETNGHPIVTFPHQAGLLIVNAAMILNRPRFLAKYGLDDLQKAMNEGGPLRIQAVGLLHAVSYLKMPVIVCNALTIVFEIILGGT